MEQKKLKLIAAAGVVIVLLICLGLTMLWPPAGYYYRGGTWYCFYDKWYQYGSSGWQETAFTMSALEARGYYKGSDYTEDMPEGMDFSETDLI